MKRALVGALVTAVIVAGGMIWLLSNRKPPPVIPGDAAHTGAYRESDCLECHGVDAPAARTKNHPLNNQCFQCHLRPGQKGL